MAISAEEFASRIRQKYPKAYDEVDDRELSAAFIEKYPEYKSQVEFGVRGADIIQPEELLQPALVEDPTVLVVVEELHGELLKRDHTIRSPLRRQAWDSTAFA